jgi:hypothetical protein
MLSNDVVGFGAESLEGRRKKQKNPAIFAISGMIRCQQAFDGRMLFLLPIWFIVAVLP